MLSKLDVGADVLRRPATAANRRSFHSPTEAKLLARPSSAASLPAGVGSSGGGPLGLGAVNLRTLSESRSFAAMKTVLWKPHSIGEPPDAPAVLAAQRNFSHARLCARGLGSTAQRPLSAGAPRPATPVDSALGSLVPDNLRPPPRVAAPLPPRLPPDHPAYAAGARAAAVSREATARAAVHSIALSHESTPAAEAAAQVAATAAATKRAARLVAMGRQDGVAARRQQAALEAEQRGAAAEESGGGGVPPPPPPPPVLHQASSSATLDPTAANQLLNELEALLLDPGAQRLFTEPKFRPPPRQLSAAEISAERRRHYGPEGSIARTLADDKASEVGVMLVTDLATAALRKASAFKLFSDESLNRMVRLGKLMRRSRYQHFYHEGSKADSVFVLVSGTVRLMAGRDQSKNGREIKPPAVLGLEALAALAEGEGEERLEGAMAVRPSVCVIVRGETIRSAVLEIAADSPFFSFEPPAHVAAARAPGASRIGAAPASEGGAPASAPAAASQRRATLA